ncbi:sigma-70 family RNA polymerase sigma factor [Embleya sp. NPDC020630]|uniref:sigma-70 family RNA polymerase sigma factor n=1 Tax=Embleya sp. NPDC020630 TaxID=3363979 RepID=UPI0037B7E8AB
MCGEGEDFDADNPGAARELRYPDGFDDFFRTEYRRFVKALMLMEEVCRADAEEWVAHAMEKLFERWNLPESDPDYVRHPRAYAMKAAKNRCKNERRRARTIPLEEVEPALVADESALTDLEDRQFVSSVLEGLSPAQRQVMHLIAEGYTPTEIAGILRKTPNNVRQIAFQGKKLLRRRWEPPTTGSPEGEEEVQ